ncbi:ubiquitin carboxyl-terminal hydrolase 26 isoform X1 [Haematococcus lacustris]|uniref:Ubiquitin carboxyl-terminal hydrolase 26 isoform X1 n=1 Tax=Haematococcus lacustris TaxID=44745 RepID=A0A699YSI8_HAELA|nr:ubiquitin carboxyl-terminal hydrolase 26 isoform X1 [Haematococcus lacustris]
MAASSGLGKAVWAGGVPGAGGAERRSSRRARKGRQPLEVSSRTSLRELKLLIFQALGVHPEDAQVYLRGQLVVGPDSQSLAALEVFPHQELQVVSLGQHDPDDLGSVFGAGLNRSEAAGESRAGRWAGGPALMMEYSQAA